MINTAWQFLDRASMDVIVLDGGLGSELERQGADLSGKLWVSKVLKNDPDLILRTHVAYFVSGADVATTSSYQATVNGFIELGMSESEAEALIRKSVGLAREARDSFWSSTEQSGRKLKPLVAASIGAYGASLADGSEFRGNYGKTVDELKDFHRTRLLLIANEKPDILACETIPCIAEVQALAELLDEPAFQEIGVPAWIAVSCRDVQHLNSGETVQELMDVLSSLNSPLVAAIGVNCTPPAYIQDILETMAAGTSLPLVAYGNMGEEWDGVNKEWVGGSGLNNDGYACLCKGWKAAGARFIGGCCRTTPQTIELIRRAVA